MEYLKNLVERSFDTARVEEIEEIQEVWSGYGMIYKVHLSNYTYRSVIVKQINAQAAKENPVSTDTEFGHERKLESYEVEQRWYTNYAKSAQPEFRTAKCLHIESLNDILYVVLEDLDSQEFKPVLANINAVQIENSLKWLAEFHAFYLNKEPLGLWPIGTYWHLDTRPDEFYLMKHEWLKTNAKKIDELLNKAKYKTFVHGDAKQANFLYKGFDEVAAVDFQYIGGGCGVKDVAYFFSSCLTQDELLNYASDLLNIYFKHLKTAVNRIHSKVDFIQLEKEWRKLYPVAWTDFARFLNGWNPNHFKWNDYLLKQIEETKSIL